MFTYKLNCLKKAEIVSKVKTSHTIVNTHEMMDSVNALILVDRRVTLYFWTTGYFCGHRT